MPKLDMWGKTLTKNGSLGVRPFDRVRNNCGLRFSRNVQIQCLSVMEHLTGEISCRGFKSLQFGGIKSILS